MDILNQYPKSSQAKENGQAVSCEGGKYVSDYGGRKRRKAVLRAYAAKHVPEDGELPMGVHMTRKTHDRIGGCSDYLELAADADIAKFRKVGGFTCRNAFCPICAHNQTLRDGLRVGTVMDYLHVKKGLEFVFLTLTAPNVKGDALAGEIRRYNAAFVNLVKRVNRRGEVVQGYARKLEVTYNHSPRITREMWRGDGRHRKPMASYFKGLGLRVGDRNPNHDTYHPHFHAILAVSPSYFKSRDYIRRDRWLAMWRGVMRDDSITQLDVRRVYKESERSGKDVAELAKYTVKDSDYLHSQGVFDTFYSSIKGCRRLTFGGEFRLANNLYKAGGLDAWKPFDDTSYAWMFKLAWGGESYAQKDVRPIGDDESARIAAGRHDESLDTGDF